jgi:hypothetical protein
MLASPMDRDGPGPSDHLIGVPMLASPIDQEGPGPGAHWIGPGCVCGALETDRSNEQPNDGMDVAVEKLGVSPMSPFDIVNSACRMSN